MARAAGRPTACLGLFVQDDRVLFAKYQRSLIHLNYFMQISQFFNGLEQNLVFDASPSPESGKLQASCCRNDISELPDLELHAIIADYMPCDFSSNSR